MDLYLIALLLPEPLHTDVWRLKQEVQRLTGSRNAVGLPPHITLVPPFRQPPAFAAGATAALAQFAAGQAACPVRLADFVWFTDRTLYVRVVPDAALPQLHSALVAWCQQQLPVVPAPRWSFVPHVTIATRDLPPTLVPALRQAFVNRPYAARGRLQTLALFRHSGREWQEVARFVLPSLRTKNPG